MTASYSTTILQKGSQGAQVKELQAKLNIWAANQGLAQTRALVEDGIFGPATERVVKVFQCRHFLTIDGIVGTATYACLERGFAGLPTLKLGSTGSVVKRLQSVLESYGIELGEVDGAYGVKTRAAVMRFQNDHHIYDRNGNVTGEVGFSTWTELAKEPVAIACGTLRLR